MSEELIYIYCVTEKAPALEEGDNGIYFISYKGLYAVVSEALSDEFGEDMLKENLGNMKWIEENVLRHERVIEEVMKNRTVIPFKFATIFKTDENVKALLREHHSEFKETLERLEGMGEWGIKMYYSLDRLKANLIKEDEEIKRIEQEINLSSTGKAYFLKKKRDELIENILNKKINEYGQDSFEKLKALSMGARINKLLPKEVTEREDEMILNAAFLVDKTKLKDFINSINYLKERYSDVGSDVGFDFDYTGPWPPYNFCDLPKEEAQYG